MSERIGPWTFDFEYGYHTATHDNYDASYEGPEDGWVDNGHQLFAKDRSDLAIEITVFEEEHGYSLTFPELATEGTSS